MSSLLDLISPFIIGALMALSGYAVILIGELMKKIIIIPLVSMLIFDSLIITMYVLLGTTKLQLNGHDRAAEQPHDYYHLVQPYESGLGHCGKSLNNDTRIWGPVVNTGDHNNVGMYSFCLKPAEHQPSGTCNFSRIDNARLTVGTVTNLYLFALNYNVLRIMSGMGGLAYSN